MSDHCSYLLVQKYGGQYVQRMLRRAAKLGATRPTDKHLLNFWHIGQHLASHPLSPV